MVGVVRIFRDSAQAMLVGLVGFFLRGASVFLQWRTTTCTCKPRAYAIPTSKRTY